MRNPASQLPLKVKVLKDLFSISQPRWMLQMEVWRYLRELRGPDEARESPAQREPVQTGLRYLW